MMCLHFYVWGGLKRAVTLSDYLVFLLLFFFMAVAMEEWRGITQIHLRKRRAGIRPYQSGLMTLC